MDWKLTFITISNTHVLEKHNRRCLLTGLTETLCSNNFNAFISTCCGVDVSSTPPPSGCFFFFFFTCGGQKRHQKHFTPALPLTSVSPWRWWTEAETARLAESESRKWPGGAERKGGGYKQKDPGSVRSGSGGRSSSWQPPSLSFFLSSLSCCHCSFLPHDSSPSFLTSFLHFLLPSFSLTPFRFFYSSILSHFFFHSWSKFPFLLWIGPCNISDSIFRPCTRFFFSFSAALHHSWTWKSGWKESERREWANEEGMKSRGWNDEEDFSVQSSVCEC